MVKPVEITSGTIFRVILILLSVWFLYEVRAILAVLVVAVIITSAMDPLVDYLQKKRVPRALTVLVIYLVGLSILSLLVSLLVPPVIEQLKGIIHNAPIFIERITGFFNPNPQNSPAIQSEIVDYLSGLKEKLSEYTPGIFSQTVSFFSGFFYVVVSLSLAFYMSVQERSVIEFIGSMVPRAHRVYAMHLTERVQRKLGKWLNGQFLLMFIVFILDYIGLTLLGVPYALVFALFAGFMEIVPFFGPIIGAIIPIIVAMNISPFIGVMTLALFLLVHQFEAYVLVPMIMKKAVGLNPIVVIIVIMIGGKIAGVAGFLLAVPLATAAYELIKDLYGAPEENSKKPPKEIVAAPGSAG